MRLSFLGGAGEVTGSCYLVDTGAVRFLVDCGMFQGGKPAQRRNRKFGFKPAEIDFVLLTHAHIDHSGLLPRLAARGFRGPVYCTPATEDLLGVMLPDSGYLQEKESGRDGEQPLYTVAQAQASLRQLRHVRYGEAFRPHASLRCMLRDAGHILGSAFVEVEAGGKKLVFSGDLGQPGRPIVEDPDLERGADVLLVESTYGDRNHKNLAQTLDEFAFALTDTLASKRGNVIIPSFAVGRTQEILYYIAELTRQGRLPPARIYVDSPMAAAATRITLKHARLPLPDKLQFTESLEDSMRLNEIRSGAIIISASGMCEGGRIRHHLRYNIARPECAIVFVGFQAAGTLGRRIVDGVKTVRILRQSYPVRAKLFTINGLSAHADRDALLAWLAAFRRPPQQCFVVHGEPLASGSLRDEIERRLAWPARVPAYGDTVEV